ncbi:MAG: glycosyltransferase family 39 protein [Acidobacteriota bacterium]
MAKRNKQRQPSRSPKPKTKRPVRTDSFSGLLSKISGHHFTPVILGISYFFIASLISFRHHQILDYGMESDFLFDYVPLARQITEGHMPIGAYRGPVYPMMLATANAIVGDYFKSGLLLSLLSAAVALAFSFSLIRRLFSGEVAVAVALLMTANTYFFMYTYQVGTDMLFCALVTACLYYLLAGTEMNWARLSVSAVLGGVAYLTRYNGIFILAVPPLILLANPLNLDWRRRLLAAGLFTVMFAACIAPWGLYLLKEKGNFFYSQNSQNVAWEIYGKNLMSREAFFGKGNPFQSMSIGALVRHNPLLFFGTLGRNFWKYGAETAKTLLGWPLAALSLAGLALLLVRKMSSRQASYLLLNVAFFLLLLPVHLEIRYPLFMLAGLLTLAVCGLSLWNLDSGRRLRVASVLLFVALVVYTFDNSYDINRREIGLGPKDVVIIADWFKANASPEMRGKIVAARKPHIAYYMGLEYLPLPFANSVEELTVRLKELKVGYLYFGAMEYSLRPELRDLIDPTLSWPGLKRITMTDRPLSILYQLE